MVGTFFAIFVMAVLYEGLKVFREVLLRNKTKIFGKIGPNTVQYTKMSSSAELVPRPNSYKWVPFCVCVCVCVCVCSVCVCVCVVCVCVVCVCV